MPPFLRQVTRYSGGGVDQRENRLTEVTAAVAGEVEGMALELARILLQSVGEPGRSAAQTIEQISEPRVRVQTQLSVPSGFVDLALTVSSADLGSNGPVVLWVEVKHGAPESGQQLENYASLIFAEGAAAHCLVVLAPRGEAAISAAVPEVSWQRLANELQAWANCHELRPKDGWLIDQYFDYLRGENLMDPDGLRASDAAALGGIGEAFSALEAVVSAAAQSIADRWGESTKRVGSPGFYFAYQERERGWGAAFPEWGLVETAKFYASSEAPAGSWAFYAGVSFGSSMSVLNGEELSLWRGQLLRDRYSWVHFGGRYRMVRLQYPEQLLGASTTAGQAELLASFVVDGLQAVPGPPQPVPSR